MLEHAIYSVISPEGAASILWRDPAPGPGRRHQHEDHRAGPPAPRRHRRDRRRSRPAAPIASRRAAIAATGEAIEAALKDLGNMGPAELRDHRAEKFLEIGRKL